ncbi:MAG: MATE family efflux transporter, partial [Ramlibacter sp.]
MNTIASPAASPPAPAGAPQATRRHQMLHAPLLPTLLRLATPNILGLFAMTLVIGYDGFILGRLGADALAGVALVLPLSMLMLQMSGGGFGGAATAAVARALGAGRADDASRLAQHALFIALVCGVLFTLA